MRRASVNPNAPNSGIDLSLITSMAFACKGG